MAGSGSQCTVMLSMAATALCGRMVKGREADIAVVVSTEHRAFALGQEANDGGSILVEACMQP